MTISHDNKTAIAITKKDHNESFVSMYDMLDYNLIFREPFLGEYIKVKEVAQNKDGTSFVVTYIDGGEFRLRLFGKTQRDSYSEIQKEEININELLKLDKTTEPNFSFDDPFINCCFISDDRIFVALFMNYHLKHIHFIWDCKFKQLFGLKPEAKYIEGIKFI